jgi:nucleoside-diphosphate-sugar epimerase
MYLNCNKAKKELGWEPKINIELGIKKTISWWKNNIK